jgi:hypothetical protein
LIAENLLVMYKLIIASILYTFSFQAKAIKSELFQDSKTYYWFYIKASSSHSRTTGISRLSIKSISNDIRSGTIEEFATAHERGIKSEKVVIGPFTQRYQAEQAQLLYRYAAKGSSGPSKTNTKEQKEPIYSFFFIKPIFMQGEGTFQRIPARVTNGTEQEYMDMLKEGLNFEKLAVGPFINYEAAEKSKYACMRSSKMESDHETDSIKNRNLRLMARRWKSLKMTMTRKSKSKVEQNAVFRFSMNIPSRYFAPDAVQVVTIKASYNSSNSASYSFTLQGDNVIDNNRVVAHDMGTVYLTVVGFDIEGKEKIESFVIDSFIYDDNDIIELDPVLIEMK